MAPPETAHKSMKPEISTEATETAQTTQPEAVAIRDLFGVFVTARIKGEIYPLQGWVISESPLRIKCTGGDEYECEGTPAVVINPPDRTPASMVCECENPGPHMKPGAGGKFCAVCGWDISPNTHDMPPVGSA